MSNTNFDNITGDGTLYTHGLVGLISRHPFLPEELPDSALIYLLHHPKRKRHTWLLENLEEIDEINPDIVLLTGGIDGGNKEVIVYNAGVLAKSKRNFIII